ncbi:N-acetylmuramoyl-L-alanine amidase [Faecalibaculum rodentium]|uniref:N-acetylmuramoyl-L-alanine amidase n=1 Tax=Faecalibaculum rodentium TaxID=1702221 RepID=UPI002570FE27|nr:N-acetylmuramoyl-L-alanine amidase [Faecalibaculum rodentium]
MKKAAIYLLLGLFALLVLHPGLNSSYTAPDVRVPTVNNSGSTTNEDATMTSSQSHAVIAVDAGHGGSDYGYVSDTTIPEKDINLDLALAIGRKLSAAGYQVVYTRESDDVPVFDTEAAASQDRLRRMKEQGVQYLVSVRIRWPGDSRSSPSRRHSWKNWGRRPGRQCPRSICRHLKAWIPTITQTSPS